MTLSRDLAGSFSKIVQNIRPLDGYDTLRKELHMYQVDEDVKKIDTNLSFDKFWSEVGKITEGSEKWQVFSREATLELALLVR